MDEDGFRRLMAEQKAAREGGREGEEDRPRGRLGVPRAGSTAPARPSSPATPRPRPRAPCAACSSAARWRPRRRAGDEIELVLDRTPFYAEGGGQLADHGLIRLGNGALVEVLDVQKPVGDLIVHRAVVRDGEVTVGQPAEAVVDVTRRQAISRAHTATHMVHRAFRSCSARPRRRRARRTRPAASASTSRTRSRSRSRSSRTRSSWSTGPGRRPRGHRADHVAARSQGDGRDGAVR